MDLLRQLVRVPGVQALWAKLGVGSLATRMRFDITERPAYAFGVYSAATLAKRVGLDAISVVEFGVAGGRGLLALERVAAEIERALSVRIAVFGFDSGTGMPAPVDYRDLPHVWSEGFYQMDVGALRSKLTHAQLVLGELGETVPRTMADSGTPPVGFVSFDLDYYSSTKTAFTIFENGSDRRLPRVYCYFDDITGPEIACMNDHVGELLAIREFNDQHARQKLAKLAYLWTEREKRAIWNEKIYVCHDFGHPLYTKNVMPEGTAFRQLPLSSR
ncbi:MAG TPA: hypothetical protein VGL59_22665 [Polyangia bacterium]|jgi:hypothetical protein